MFEPTDKARVYGLSPGTDFPRALADGILLAMADKPPEAMPRVRILVNTRRMQRRLLELFADGEARLLPQIGLVTDLDGLLPDANLPPLVSPLRRQLELAQLVTRLIDSDESVAPRSAVMDLADSLARLMDEMEGEGVRPERIEEIDTGDESGHWQRSLGFLGIVRGYFESVGTFGADPEARRRLTVETLCRKWQTNPPEEPVIVAGSTGSRTTTSLLMQGVARLPQGALLLPGFDFDLPDEVWTMLAESREHEEHPQFRFAALLSELKIGRKDVMHWSGDPPDPHRNRLISLALRPAPVTNQWLDDGPGLGDLRAATAGLTLIEAPQPRAEATAIAVAIRQAVGKGKTVALITPDRTLGRRVAAAVARWGIVPDDSSGRPLNHTPPGRFLRQVAGLIGLPARSVDLIALLKHPLTRTGAGDRNVHLLHTREFELYLRRKSMVQVTPEIVKSFLAANSADAKQWGGWLSTALAELAVAPSPGLSVCLEHHIGIAEFVASGRRGGSGALWDRAAGRDVLALVDSFRSEPDFAYPISFADYLRLFERALATSNTRADDESRPDVMIWGTLEARVQGADLVILGGLNEGTWPELPAADPWLNRRIRRSVGLLLPERETGLAAHDFQQAAAAPEVILTRARRDADSETVPSRWLNRLTNLLKGLPAQGGDTAIEAMQSRGDMLLRLARALDEPAGRDLPARRPFPAPPVAVRPKTYSVTEIERLVRDPYAIYARHVLGLRKLDPLNPTPDARTRGTMFHKVVERAFAPSEDFSDIAVAVARFHQIAADCLAALPWPAVRTHWQAHLDAIAEKVVLGEIDRRAAGDPIKGEVKGRLELRGTPFTIIGKADRIDRLTTGELAIYDYKSGTPPTPKQVRYFDRQLPIEALMAEQGAFEGVAPAKVARVAHIGLGRNAKTSEISLEDDGKVNLRTVTVLAELVRLLSAYNQPGQGYRARRSMEKVRFESDYDHLARFGEWTEGDGGDPEILP